MLTSRNDGPKATREVHDSEAAWWRVAWCDVEGRTEVQSATVAKIINPELCRSLEPLSHKKRALAAAASNTVAATVAAARSASSPKQLASRRHTHRPDSRAPVHVSRMSCRVVGCAPQARVHSWRPHTAASDSTASGACEPVARAACGMEWMG